MVVKDQDQGVLQLLNQLLIAATRARLVSPSSLVVDVVAVGSLSLPLSLSEPLSFWREESISVRACTAVSGRV